MDLFKLLPVRHITFVFLNYQAKRERQFALSFIYITRLLACLAFRESGLF